MTFHAVTEVNSTRLTTDWFLTIFEL